ncbi:MAG: hypothetical protein AB7T06_43850 [Kofleriaceae bacterium]
MHVIAIDDSIVVALADGAGGVANGARAAQSWIDVVAENPTRAAWRELVEELDADSTRRGAGQTTAIAIEVTADGLSGVCVGDSAVWLITDTEVIDLAEHVPPKPLVGDGCMVYEVESCFDRGTLLVASDGLVKYASRGRIAEIARGESLEVATSALITLVRRHDGTLTDDTTVVLVRRPMKRAARWSEATDY